MRAVAVTGGTGYVGGRVVGGLATAGLAVRSVGRRTVPWLGDVDQLTLDLGGPIDRLAAAFAGCDAVVHLAGANEVEAGRDPDRTTGVAIQAARHVATAAAEAGVARLVVASTIHVYGAALAPGARIDETTAPEPRHPYGIARLASEHVAHVPGLDVVVLRLSNGVGAPASPAVDRWTLVANDLCRQAVREGRLTLDTHGRQWRDFIALTDVVVAVLAACDPGRIPAGTFLVARGEPLTIHGVAELVADAAWAAIGARPPITAPRAPDHPDEPYHLDAGRLAAAGFEATTPIRQAIDETLAFCIQHREAL